MWCGFTWIERARPALRAAIRPITPITLMWAQGSFSLGLLESCLSFVRKTEPLCGGSRGIRLGRWRPFPSFVAAQFSPPAYYAQIVGSAVVLFVTNGTRNGLGCRNDHELLALDLRDGRPLWCTDGLPRGDITFVPVSENNTLLAWATSDDSLSLLAYDLRTGTARWNHVVGVKGADWKRVITYMTGLPAPPSARPPLYHSGRVCLIVSEVKRFGPAIRPPDQATFRLIDVETGRVVWEIVERLPGRMPWLSWTFSERSYILTTGRLVSAYDVSSGEKQWTTPLDDVRSLRVAQGRRRNVLLVDFGARRWGQPGPTRRGEGLAALDLTTGKLIWRDSEARVLQSLDQVGPEIFLEAGDAVRSLDVETGAETNRLRPAFENRVRYAGLSVSGRTMLQSATEVAAYDDESKQPAFQETVPRAFRGIGRALISGTFSPVLLGAWIVAEIVAPGSSGLRSGDSEPGTKHAFFATGRGRDSRLVAVDTETGKLQTVSPYIWTDNSRFSLGNLLDEPHGLVYTMSGRTITAYALEIDQNAHRTLHQRAHFRRALEARGRALAFSNMKQVVAARREASAALLLLESLVRGVDLPTGVVAFAYGAIGDSHVVLAESAPGQDGAEQRIQAVTAYEQALRLLGEDADVRGAGVKADVQGRLDRVRSIGVTK